MLNLSQVNANLTIVFCCLIYYKDMFLCDLISKKDILELVGSLDTDVCSICFDSREVRPNALFVAINGSEVNGHKYINNAIASGAVAVVCDEMPENMEQNVVYIRVSNSAISLGHIASKFYGDPSKKLKLFGVTGTNGKTTTATLLYNLFTELGYSCGLISTVSYSIAGKVSASSHTTPDAVRLNAMLQQMVAEGCQYCFMEVSSHSIVQHRIEGLYFVGGLFTNITHDHLDYHGTFAEYIKAKKLFFDSLPQSAFALYNSDDRNGSVMVQNCKATIKSFGLKGLADFKCRINESMFGGMQLYIDNRDVWVRFIGRFNAYNITGVYAAAVMLGEEPENVLRIISTLGAVAGRFDYVVSRDGKVVIVDYAHTPDALENVMDTINEIRTPAQRLHVVVGCGGNRDKTKRPIMARIALEKSDFAVLTSDNPRLENPDDILSDMAKGLADCVCSTKGRYAVVQDRAEAIRVAIAMARGASSEADNATYSAVGDIVLIAGKGHENYQIIGQTKHHFDDKEQALLNLDMS